MKSEPDAHLLGLDLGGFRGERLLERRDQEREPLGVFFYEILYFSSGVNFILSITIRWTVLLFVLFPKLCHCLGVLSSRFTNCLIFYSFIDFTDTMVNVSCL